MVKSNPSGDYTYDVTFVNVSHPGQLRERETQKVIRRRVMRDIGRSRRKHFRPITLPIDIPPSQVLVKSPVDDKPNESNRVGWTSSFTDISKSLQPYGYFAVEPSTRARQLFHFMHGATGYVYRPFRIEWFAMAMADHCAFYLCLANAALFYHRLTEGGSYEYSDCEESARYFSHCTGMMAQRLGSAEDGTSEGVITTVLGFLCHDASVGKWDRWSIHMDGLRQILQLRRGFSGLSDDTHMFACWFDVTGCAIHDATPRVTIPPGLPQASVLAYEVSPALANILSTLTRTRLPRVLQVCEALEQTALVAAFIDENHHKSRFWECGIHTTRLLAPAAHHALLIPRMTATLHAYPSTGAQVLCEMVRLALLIFIARLKKAFSLIADEMAAFQQKFDNILARAHEAFEFYPELVLWSMIVVAQSHPPPRNHSLINAIRHCMASMSTKPYTTWNGITMAKSIIWVEPLMEVESEDLAQEIESAPFPVASKRFPTTHCLDESIRSTAGTI